MSPHPLTRPEATDWQETSLHAHVLEFLSEIEKRRDPRVVRTSFGASPEGRELPLLVLSKDGLRTPEEARASGRPIVLIINGIHAGEVEGKEASLMLVRDWLDGRQPGLFDELVTVIVPLFNPDGNDRIDPANRKLDIAKLAGHIGPPKGVGTRVNASGINLNRDYMRQEAPEMRLLQSKVYRPWRAHLSIDCHATNGSVHRFALTYDTPHVPESGRREPIEYLRQRFLPVVTERLKARTGLATFFYGNFVADEGGTGQGWMTYPNHPRFGGNFRGLHNRLDLLLETYSYLEFPERVRTTYEFLVETLRLAAERGREIVELCAKCELPPKRVAVRYKLESEPGEVEILTREPRTLDGKPTSVRIPHLAKFVGTEVVDRPLAYVVPAACEPFFELHGLPMERLQRATVADVEVAHVLGLAADPTRGILESSTESELLVRHERTKRTLPAGALLVRTEHALGAVATYLCEAKSDDGLVQCGILSQPKAGEEFPVLRVLSLG
ncbi:MAG: peptidase [Planctomycetaceae bacterium]|nr:peptidase [Planctomycetaceae bacterium]